MLTKKAQTKSNRLRPKPSMKNNRKVSGEDKAYLEYLQTTSYTCMVCGTGMNIEWHHVKRDSSDKKDHTSLIPLCYMHHRLSDKISAHGTPKLFRQTYPVDAQRVLARKIYDEYLSLSN